MRRCSDSSPSRWAWRMSGASPAGSLPSRITLPRAHSVPGLPSWCSTCCKHDGVACLSRDGRAGRLCGRAAPSAGGGGVVVFAPALLGVGGGVVMVPLLVWTFTSHGLPTEHVVHLALGI